MTTTACALLGFVVWSVLLSFALVGVRAGAIRGGHALNTFRPEGTDLDDFGRRVTRAYANSLENLAIMASLLLYAIATDQQGITNGLAAVAFGARVVQSAAHVASGSVPAVLVRASAFGVQMIIALIWAWRFWAAAMPA
ncbi:MAG TPA: MAPEG family protein [Gammaproteobacteria bacterium]|nr:MAPEG family protein [Gammaproteobacteria bacterium]